jgi:hypothetical protein
MLCDACAFVLIDSPPPPLSMVRGDGPAPVPGGWASELVTIPIHGLPDLPHVAAQEVDLIG